MGSLEVQGRKICGGVVQTRGGGSRSYFSYPPGEFSNTGHGATIDCGRKTPCRVDGRGSLEQGQKPRPLCAAESERVYPSCHLGAGRTRKEEAGGALQELHSTSHRFSGTGSSV